MSFHEGDCVIACAETEKHTVGIGCNPMAGKGGQFPPKIVDQLAPQPGRNYGLCICIRGQDKRDQATAIVYELGDYLHQTNLLRLWASCLWYGHEYDNFRVGKVLVV